MLVRHHIYNAAHRASLVASPTTVVVRATAKLKIDTLRLAITYVSASAFSVAGPTAPVVYTAAQALAPAVGDARTHVLRMKRNWGDLLET